MPGQDRFKVEGTVVDVLPHTMFRLELANGHRLLARVPVKLRGKLDSLAVGDRVWVEVSPFDLSQGCIVQSAAAPDGRGMAKD